MPTVTVTLPSNNALADVQDYNDPINAILAVLNGQLDDNNIASVNGSKIVDGTITQAKLAASLKTGWWTDSTLLPSPNSVVYNGNRSYTLTFNSVDVTSILSAKMRMMFARSATPPTQCTSLNGTNQYYSKTSPAGMTFTDDFTIGAWIKLSSYPSGDAVIVSRYNGTSGWRFVIQSTGQVYLAGLNAGSANLSRVSSVQSVPLNKWVHVAAQLDMSSFTVSATTSYVMIDGLDVPATVGRGGTNPTALVQAGNLEVGSENGGTNPLSGKLAQVAIYSAKVTQATMRASVSQTLAGTETSLVSAYSFNNTINDLNTTNANNLTANNSAAATNADSPFNATEYGIVSSASFSTNSTVVVQVPEGYALPTSGGITTVSYSINANPLNFPSRADKWTVESLGQNDIETSSPVAGTWYNNGGVIQVPIGAWKLGYQATMFGYKASSFSMRSTLSTANNSESDKFYTLHLSGASDGGNFAVIIPTNRSKNLTLSTATSYYLNVKTDTASSATVGVRGDLSPTSITAEYAYL